MGLTHEARPAQVVWEDSMSNTAAISISRGDEANAETSAQADVRPVTDHEVAFFVQNGWVLLRGLVSPGLCALLLERGKARLSPLIDATDHRRDQPGGKQMRMAESEGEGTLTNIHQWCEWRGAVRSARDPLFSRLALSKTTGRNVQRLLERDRPLRVYHDMFVCKLPDNISTPTACHQDATNFALDRNVLTVWIALAEVTPDQGPVQFYSGSHRCGLLGGIPPGNKFDLVDEYPELARFPVSPAHHLQPGDCTVHHGLVVHGATANATPRPRYSFITSYFPADARYTGAPNHDTDGFGFKRGETLSHPSFTPVPE
jgi:hypothetical protein